MIVPSSTARKFPTQKPSIDKVAEHIDDVVTYLALREVRMQVLILTIIFGCVALVGCEEFDTPQVTAQSH